MWLSWLTRAIARAWPATARWLDDDADGQRIWRHCRWLQARGRRWDDQTASCNRGTRLAQAERVRGPHGADLNPTERAFLEAGEHHAGIERVVARRRRRAITGVLVRRRRLPWCSARSRRQARRVASERDRALSAKTTPGSKRWSTARWRCARPIGAVAARSRWKPHRRAPGDPRAHSACRHFTAAQDSADTSIFWPEPSADRCAAARCVQCGSSPSPDATATS